MAIEGQFFRLSAGHSFLFGLRGAGKSRWLHGALPNAGCEELLCEIVPSQPLP